MEMKNLYQRFERMTQIVKLCPMPELIKSWAAVELMVHVDWKQGPSVVMIKRAKNENDPWSGHYAFPGGRVEAEESLKQAARRESLEEVGFSASDDFYLGEFLQLQLKYRGQFMPFAISSHVTFMTEKPPFNLCPQEVEQAFWFPLVVLSDPSHIKEKVFTMSTWSGKLPCIEFDGHTIWGISYVILRELFIQWHGQRLTSEFIVEGGRLPEYPHIAGTPFSEKIDHD